MYKLLEVIEAIVVGLLLLYITFAVFVRVGGARQDAIFATPQDSYYDAVEQTPCEQ